MTNHQVCRQHSDDTDGGSSCGMATSMIQRILLTASFAFLLPMAVFGQNLAPGEATEGITGAGVQGEIEYIAVDDPTDVYSAGTMVVAGQAFIIPANLLIDLPANRLTLQQVLAQAPPEALALGESGLCKGDSTLRGRQGGFAFILGNQMVDGRQIAGDVFIQKSSDFFSGNVTFINHDEGYFCLNGIEGQDGTGTMVRINDPDAVHTIQSGSGCTPGMPNCSPDVRYCNDPENYTITFSNGYPMCIPSTVTGGARTQGADADGRNDEYCPHQNRQGPLRGNGREATDSRYQAPMQVGDNVGVEGSPEVINGVSFFSAHTCTGGKAIVTRDDPTQPCYLMADEVEWDAPGFANERVKVLLIGFSTLDSSQVDIYALDKDPTTNEDHQRLIGSTRNNPITVNHGIGQGSAGIFKVTYDVDFLKGAPVGPRSSPCAKLTTSGYDVCPQGGTMNEEFALLTPITREAIFISAHNETLEPGIEAYNLQGDPWFHGQYLTPAGIGHPEWDEIDLNRMWMPFIFAGEPWNLDRRLSPGGCDDTNGDGAVDCEDLVSAPIGSLHLDPFPYGGVNPMTGLIGGSNLDLEFDPIVDPVTGEICGNGLDDDGDLLIDCDDPECDNNADCVAEEQAGGAIGEICGNLDLLGQPVDDDDDGLIDCFDPECQGAADCIGIGAVLGFTFVPTNMERMFGYYPFTYEDADGDPTNGAEHLVTMIPFANPDGTITSYATDLKPAEDPNGAMVLPPLVVACANFNSEPAATPPGLGGLGAVMDTPLTVAEADIATDADGDSLIITFGPGSSGGTLELVGTDYIYTPATGFTGEETFTFSVDDRHGGETTGSISFSVQ